MSRTRHHTNANDPIRSKRKRLADFKQKQLKRLKLDDWYIELPISNNFNFRKTAQ